VVEFCPYYKGLVAQLYGPLSPADGFSDDEVGRAERRLGIRLPRLLREFYLLAGRRADLNQAHDELVHPDDLQIEDETLVFYVENQAVSIWGVQAQALGADDPPVVRGDSVEGFERRVWGQDFERLSAFLLAMLCWQGVMGGMAYGAVAVGIDARVEEAVGAHWQPLDLGVNGSGIRPHVGEGQLLCLAEARDEVSLYAAARDEKGLAGIEELLQITWDYSSSDEGRDRA
jgi:hypothetical protein